VYFPGGKPPFPGRKSRFPGRKKRRAARKDLSGQIAVFPVSDRTNSHLTGRRILFPLRQTHRSVCHAERKSPLTHSADTGKIDLKRSSGTEILLRPVDKVRFHNADTAARASEKKTEPFDS